MGCEASSFEVESHGPSKEEVQARVERLEKKKRELEERQREKEERQRAKQAAEEEKERASQDKVARAPHLAHHFNIYTMEDYRALLIEEEIISPYDDLFDETESLEACRSITVVSIASQQADATLKPCLRSSNGLGTPLDTPRFSPSVSERPSLYQDSDCAIIDLKNCHLDDHRSPTESPMLSSRTSLKSSRRAVTFREPDLPAREKNSDYVPHNTSKDYSDDDESDPLVAMLKKRSPPPAPIGEAEHPFAPKV